MTSNDAPLVAALTHRLSECPSAFLESARVDGKGIVHVDAVVADLVRFMGGPMLTAQDTKIFRAGRGGAAAPNHLQIVLIASWLLHDAWFADRRSMAGDVPALLATTLAKLAGVVAATLFVTDPDRREELVRICLRELGVRPAGEGVHESADRLSALDSVQRQRVAAEAVAAEERARKVREAMKKKEAEEAAARYGRE